MSYKDLFTATKGRDSYKTLFNCLQLEEEEEESAAKNFCNAEPLLTNNIIINRRKQND